MGRQKGRQGGRQEGKQERRQVGGSEGDWVSGHVWCRQRTCYPRCRTRPPCVASRP